MGDPYRRLKGQITVHLAILLLMLMLMIPWCTSHYALDSPEKSNNLGFFHCNGSSAAECFSLGFNLLVESETRRMLQQGGGRPSSNTLKPNAACNRDKFGYLCTPPRNKDVKRSENCRGSTFNRGCHQIHK